ncbi:MAG: hypothetical protein JST14_09070 [Bacteroidetes bacterium]|nr:hypothetical protein [Bacteroidota bacterium]
MNPFFGYAVACALTLILYSLHWSGRYPPLSASLGIFLGATILIHLLTGQLWKRSFSFPSSPRFPAINHFRVTAVIYALWTLDFIYEGGVPLIKILLHQPYNYRLFGFPTVHVFTVTFASCYTVFLFYQFLVTKKGYLLLLWTANLMAAVLIYSRAMLVFNLVSCAFVWLGVGPYRKSLLIPAAIIALSILLYLFGVLGNLRVSREAGKAYTNDLFLEVGKATPEFAATGIPKEYFWSYVYLTSPIANLQSNLNHPKPLPISGVASGQMVINEFLFDFISKRVNRYTGHTPLEGYTIGPPFNVSTVYSGSFTYQQWPGMIAMALFLVALPWLYLKCTVRHSVFSTVGISILCTIYCFLLYDNTIRFTGLAFQLVYPVLAGWIDRGKLKLLVLKDKPIGVKP